MRNSLINGAEVVSYDQGKQILIERGVPDTPLLHASLAIMASFNAAAISGPFDVVKTRSMSEANPAKRPNYLQIAR